MEKDCGVEGRRRRGNKIDARYIPRGYREGDEIFPIAVEVLSHRS